MAKRNLLWCGAALLATLACGGGGGGGGTPRSTVKASQLAYQASASTTTWRLVQDPASVGNKLVLDLMAPAGTLGQGFTVVLTTDPANAAWTKVDGTSFALQNQFAAPAVSLVSVSASGADLRVVFGQTPGNPVNYGSNPVVQVALTLPVSATVGGVTLAASLAGNLGTNPTPDKVTVSVGALTAQ